MKVYVVEHHYDNGENYDDYRAYHDTYLFSTDKNALHFYTDKIMSDYEGMYQLIIWELDTQEKLVVGQSEWKPCSSEYDKQVAHEQEEYFKAHENDDPSDE